MKNEKAEARVTEKINAEKMLYFAYLEELDTCIVRLIKAAANKVDKINESMPERSLNTTIGDTKLKTKGKYFMDMLI